MENYIVNTNTRIIDSNIIYLWKFFLNKSEVDT